MSFTQRQALMVSVAEAREMARFDDDDHQDELDRWYESGKQLTSGPKGDLMRKEDEREEDWKQRVARMATVNALARIVDAVSDWIYHESPKRSLNVAKGGESKADEVLQDQLRRMKIRLAERDRGAGQVLRGKAWDCYGWRASRGPGDPGSITVRPVRRRDIYAEYDPTDPSRPTLLIHRFARDGAAGLATSHQYVMWTDGAYASYDDNGAPLPLGDLPPSGPNPFRLVPFSESRGLAVPGTERCVSLVRDVIGLQRLVLNKISDLDQLVRYQSGDVFVLKGHMSRDVTTGSSRFIELPAMAEADAFFASPAAKITEALDVIKQHVEWCFQTCGLPVTVLTGEQTESGYALAVRYQQAVSMVKKYQERGAVGEEHALRVMCAVGRYGGLPLPEPWSFEPIVEFSDQIFPADRDAQRMADAEDVDRGRMTLKDYLRRHRKDIPEDGLDAYIADIRAEQASKPKLESPFGFGVGGAL